MRFLLRVGSLPQHSMPDAITIVMGFHQMGVKLYQEWKSVGFFLTFLEGNNNCSSIHNNICTKLNTGFSAHTYKEGLFNS